MTFIAGNYLLIASIIIFVGILLSKIAPKVGVPTLLIFLLVGMLFGSDGVGVQFDNIVDAQFIGMIALSIILFTGGMSTDLNEIRPVIKQGISLATLGVALTTVLTGTFIYYLCIFTGQEYKIEYAVCLLLAATMASTDSASVFSILREQKMGLKYNSKPLIELESGSNDPMAYMLTILLIQICQTSDFSAVTVITNFLIQFVVG
ncbi:MAG: cation:proton antiporter, partial [Bacteroidales bacterium]|nr:cation:proton antiporter [Bacteroidales bacterium]